MQSSIGSGSLQSVLEMPHEMDEALAEMARAKSARAKTFIFLRSLQVKTWKTNDNLLKGCLGLYSADRLNFIH